MRKLLKSSIFIGLYLFLCGAYAQEKVTEFSYDELGRLNTVKDSVNGDRTYTYDAAGNRINVAVASVSSASSSSTACAALALKVEAESYSAMFGVQAEPTKDIGGGSNLGYMHPGDWMSYGNSTVNVVATGTYRITFRVASPAPGGGVFRFHELDGSKEYGTVVVPVTGGVQVWADATLDVTLSAGVHTFGITVLTRGGGFNLNWFKVESLCSSSSSSVLLSSSSLSSLRSSSSVSLNSSSLRSSSLSSLQSSSSVSLSSSSLSSLRSSSSVSLSSSSLSSLRSSSSSSSSSVDSQKPSAPGVPVIGPITALSATAGWSTATDNVAVTGYEYSLDSGATWKSAGASLSANLTSLSPETNYTIQVRAFDAVGNRGAFSETSFKTLQVAPPGAVTIGAITATSATASWAASSTQGVTYEYTSNGGATWSPVSEPTVTLLNLTPNTTYPFTVRAVYYSSSLNKVWRSTDSSANFTTLPYDVAPPGAVTISSITTTTATASWGASATLGVTYQYQLYAGGNWNPVSTATSVNLTVLNSNSGYNFCVMASIGGKNSAPTCKTFSTLAPTVQPTGTPSFTSITATSAAVSWGPSSTSSATYEWTIDNWATTITNTGFPYGTNWNLTNLTPSSNYTFRVRAVKDNVRSSESTNNFRTADVGVPGAPSFSNITSSSVTATWGQSATLNATYEWSIDNIRWNQTSSTSVPVSGLASATGYTFYVKAIVSGVRSGASSAPFTTLNTVVSDPGKPVFSNKTTTSVTVNWTPSATSGATYEWTIDGGVKWNTASSSPVTVSGLTPYTGYTFAVKALYGGIRSGASSDLFTTLPVPLTMVGALSLSASSTSMYLQWDAATGNPGPTQYEYSFTNSNPWYSVGTARQVTVTGLTANTSYTFYVRAINALGESNSISGTKSTTPPPLARPDNANCDQKWGAGAWQGTWNAVPGAHHYVFKAMNKAEVTVFGTDTGSTPIQQSTKPCVWVQACDVNGNCGPQTYFP